jgi:RNA polymerase sigma-70 factor (ECF subfamily)
MPADAAAFCAAEYPRLVGGLTLYTGQQDLAEELAQEALLRACQRWERVRVLESPGGWVWRVAVNLGNSHFRRRKVASRARERLQNAVPKSQIDADAGEAVAVRRAVAALLAARRQPWSCASSSTSRLRTQRRGWAHRRTPCGR